MNSIKIFLVVSSILLTHLAQAQHLTWFEAEGDVYYEMVGCISGSDIQYYSGKGGGKLLANVQANGSGIALFKSDHKFKPAAVLNTKTPNKKKIAGTGKLLFIGEKDFSFKNAALEQKNEQIYLEWTSSLQSDEVLEFEILKSNDAINYMTAGKLTGVKSKLETSYNFKEENTGSALFYKVRIILGGDQKFVSKVYSLDNKLGITPSSATSLIQLTVPNGMNTAEYRIISESGQVVLTGTLTSITANISVNNLAAGNYFVMLNSANKKFTGRFIKL